MRKSKLIETQEFIQAVKTSLASQTKEFVAAIIRLTGLNVGDIVTTKDGRRLTIDYFEVTQVGPTTYQVEARGWQFNSYVHYIAHIVDVNIQTGEVV